MDWPTYSPICAPTIMVAKKDDDSGEVKMRMVVNYQALNALTIDPDFPLPPIQTSLEMLREAKYFSTLDLEAGFHQIRMAKEDRWRTVFRSVMRLFEYKVMPLGLKGAPATFQASMNAYLQPVLGQGVTAYLDDVLMYSPDLLCHATLLRQVLSIFLQHQFYPKFCKCTFAKRELTYLGDTVSAEGIKPAQDEIEAIRVWFEVLKKENQLRQFLGTVNYRRMFMGLDYAEIARPLVDLTPCPPLPPSPTMVPQEATVGWHRTRNAAGNPAEQYVVDYLLDQRGPGAAAQYVIMWPGAPEERATWECTRWQGWGLVK
ncbi:hypothetical protein EBH_0024340 [Eimeria brunetti]|uniref:Reverse transcriptase domain-containing protein n=1 Tax=Eimeria brunetti TaxID=51314 RepID=U6LFG8_9EIME|nr:hypothetical protein EBH_0024340 [Eimeria brunetti]